MSNYESKTNIVGKKGAITKLFSTFEWDEKMSATGMRTLYMIWQPFSKLIVRDYINSDEVLYTGKMTMPQEA